MPTCYIAVGSNLDDRDAYIDLAVEMLQKRDDIFALTRSPLYETKPENMPKDAPKFLNGVLQIQTFLTPKNLLAILHDVEKELGRENSVDRKTPQNRTIDLDLLLYGDEVVEEPTVMVPHPRLHTRAFVLKPLNDLCPGKVVPGQGKSVKELLDDLGTLEGIVPYESTPSN